MSMSTFEHSIDAYDSLPLVYHHDIITPSYNHPNWHSNIELLYVTGGSGTVLSGSHTYNACAGDIFVINTNEIHSVLSDSVLYNTCIIIDNSFCIANNIPVEQIEFETQVKSTELAKLCKDLVFELDNASDFKIAAVKTALLRVILELARHHSSSNTLSDKQANSSNENMRLAMGYIKSHISENITLDEIAFQSGLSKFYFSREFKKVTGMTPVTYINTLRCNEAKKLLKSNRYTVQKVSELCGFSNFSYFSKTFKKYTGVLPSKWGC